MRRVKRIRREDGQALVEFAFVLPLLILFLFGIIDFGLAVNNYNANTNVANVAVRQVSVLSTNYPTCNGTSETTLLAYVSCKAQQTGGPTPTSACVADTSSGTPSSTYTQYTPVEVKVTSTFSWLSVITNGVGAIGGIHPATNITAAAVMRLEQAPSSNGLTFLQNSTLCSS